MNVNYRELIKSIKGTFVPKPISGTLSGHAAGEPFDKHVYKEIKKQLPHNTFRQYEYLNDLYSKNAETIGIQARQALFDSPSVLFLLSRGKEATNKWSLENPFEEKQDDTADVLVVKDDFYEVIDVKTRNLSKTAQAPNIISAFKLAQLCAIMLDNKEFDNLSINYFEVDWILEEDKLVCEDAHFINLFKSIPKNLYINWAAAMQIQFHVCNLDQDFKGTIEEWAKLYLKHFVEQVYRRSEYMINKYAKPFEKYLNLYCQSCGMPLQTANQFGTNADGSANQEYCCYCYKEGTFVQDCTMEGMIEHCIKYLDEFNGACNTQHTKEEATADMKNHFPTLKRWAK